MCRDYSPDQWRYRGCNIVGSRNCSIFFAVIKLWVHFKEGRWCHAPLVSDIKMILTSQEIDFLSNLPSDPVKNVMIDQRKMWELLIFCYKRGCVSTTVKLVQLLKLARARAALHEVQEGSRWAPNGASVTAILCSCQTTSSVILHLWWAANSVSCDGLANHKCNMWAWQTMQIMTSNCNRLGVARATGKMPSWLWQPQPCKTKVHCNDARRQLGPT